MADLLVLFARCRSHLWKNALAAVYWSKRLPIIFWFNLYCYDGCKWISQSVTITTIILSLPLILRLSWLSMPYKYQRTFLSTAWFMRHEIHRPDYIQFSVSGIKTNLKSDNFHFNWWNENFHQTNNTSKSLHYTQSLYRGEAKSQTKNK